MLSQYQSHASRRSWLGLVLATSAILGPLCTAYAAKGSLSHSFGKEIDASSLDPRIQEIASSEIAEAVKRYRAKSGAIAVADPRSGRILAFAEFGSVAEAGSWKSRTFAPASVLKPFVVAAAIDAGTSREDQVYDCRDPYYVAGKKFVNWNSSFSDVSLTDAIAKSVNVCLIKVAQDLGSTRLRETLSEFGFDTKSQWRTDRSDALQLANASLGMGRVVPATMESITKAYSVLANRGHLWGGDSDSVISESTAEAVSRMLVETVANGTGQEAAIPGTRVAGKTGTLRVETRRGKPSYLASFAGYAPAESPRLVTFVVIENGHEVGSDQKGVGGSIAAPVFKTLTEKILPLAK